MPQTPRMLTKRSTVLGLPVGPRSTDWRKIGMLGAGVASVVAAKRAVPTVAKTVSAGVGKVTAPVKKGKEGLQNFASLGDQAGSISTAMSGASSPFGKAIAGFKSIGSDDAGSGDSADTDTDTDTDAQSNGGDQRNVQKLRLIIKESIEVGVPRKVAYNQWTQFTELPSIVKGVAAVSQEEDDKTRWTVKIGPSRRTWRAEILEQTPDERIAWESTDGTENRGAVTFHSLDRNLTRVQVEMEYFPKGIVEKTGNLFLAARRRVRKDLRLFKHYLELAGEETGAWRGEISKDDESSQNDDDQTNNESQESGERQESGETVDLTDDNGQESDSEQRDQDRSEATSSDEQPSRA